MRRVHIERKSLAPESAIEAVRQALAQGPAQARGVWVTAADASVASGLPLADAEQALLSLSTRFPCRLGVTDSGGIALVFESLEPPRPETRWTRAVDWLVRHRDQVLAVFTVVLLPFLVLVGFMGTATLMYGLDAGALADQPTLQVALRVFGGILALGFLGLLFFAVALTGLLYLTLVCTIAPVMFFSRPLWDEAYAADFELGMHLGVSVMGSLITLGIAGYLLGVVKGMARKAFAGESASWARTFWRAVGGFFVGPARATEDPLEDERRLTALIRERAGVVTTADLMGLFGWLPDECDSQIVRVMMDYGGDVLVTDDGAILWVFPDFAPRARAVEVVGGDRPEASRTTATAAPSTGPVFRAPPVSPERFFGCRTWVWVTGLVLMVPMVLGPALHPWIVTWPGPAEFFVWHGPEDHADPGMQALGAWPAVVLWLALLSRIPRWLVRRRSARRLAREHALIRAACETPGGTELEVRAGDTRLLARLEAELEPSERGLVRVRFPRIAESLVAAERVRTQGFDLS